MPRAIPAAISVEAVRKWLFLAKQRMAHLVELYESGRWRYYYTDAEFIDRLREAIRGVDRWSATEQAVIDRLADGAAESERRVASDPWSVSGAA